MKSKESITAKKFEKQAQREFHGKTIGAYQTYPLSDANRRDDETNIAIPSDEDVFIAKQWVDENIK